MEISKGQKIASYVIPKTNVLGAAFLTAWLGGAVATHMINEDPLFNPLNSNKI